LRDSPETTDSTATKTVGRRSQMANNGDDKERMVDRRLREMRWKCWEWD